jgi:hypothetical protein
VDFDLELANARILGEKVRAIASPETRVLCSRRSLPDSWHQERNHAWSGRSPRWDLSVAIRVRTSLYNTLRLESAERVKSWKSRVVDANASDRSELTGAIRDARVLPARTPPPSAGVG